MRFRRQDQSTKARRTPRAAAFVLALGLGGMALFGAGPAYAATTVNAQLTLTGVATGSSPTGGSVIGAHPGDAVTFSTGAVPTAGVPGGLGASLGSLLGGLAAIQVTINSSSVPGLPAGTMFGGCASPPLTSKTTPGLAKGTYNFTYSVKSVSVVRILGCTVGPSLDLNGNQAAAAKVKLNAANQYVGQVVVAATPPGGGISLQLPSVSVSPNILGIQLPTVGLPGLTTPTVGLPATGSGGGTTTPAPTTTAPSIPAPFNYGFPKGGSCCGLTADQYQATTPSTGSSSSGYVPLAGLANQVTPGTSSGAAPNTAAGATPTTKAKTQAFDYAANHAPAGQMPILLAILAVLALSLVTATYARLYLLRR